MNAKNYTTEDLRTIYTALYNDNMEGAEDDYADFFSSEYNPDNIPRNISVQDMVGLLKGLVNELFESYECGAAEVARVAVDAGADDGLLKFLGLIN